jgi:cytochrome P450
MRRNLSHAFSDKALRQQEPLIQSYVDLLVHRLGEHATEGKNVDIMHWYNYTTFDIISDLSFGEPLYCLRDSAYHKWVHLVFAFVKTSGFAATRNKYLLFNILDTLRSLFTLNNNTSRTRTEFFAMARDKVERRLQKIGDGDEKPDFWSYVIANQGNEGKRLERGEMHSNAVTLLVAGSETTATTLSGTTYLLLKNASAYDKLVSEIRNAFATAGDITIEAVNKLPYLVACLNEGLRYYPPVPTGFPRTVPPAGDTISGFYVPGGTAVYVSQHATHHSERNFRDPGKYVPERWLGEDKYENDRREAVNAFSFGPRACLGKNLAYAEMRLILAKVLFAFDLELVDKERDWTGEQKCFTLWEKQALEVRLKAVQR